MNADTIMTYIGSLGFPIVVACAVMWYVYEFTGKLTEQLTQMNTILNHLLTVMEENTKVLEEVNRRLDLENKHE